MKEKTKKIEVFNMETGKWEPKAVTEEEYGYVIEIEQQDQEVLQAEFEIVQRSIAMQMNEKTEDKSKD
jgi:hypothetical protein